MKKRILMSLVATFIIAVSAFAQTNAYSMKLTLKDGTVIVIGPNDLQELNFIEGTPTVSGTNITTLMSSITAMQAQIDLLHNYLAMMNDALEKVNIDVMASKEAITSMNKEIKMFQSDIANVYNVLANNAAATAALQANLDATAAEVKEVEKRIEDNMASIAKLENEINMNQKSIDETKAQIANNADAINNLQEDVMANKVELQQAIATVKDEEDAKIHQAVDDMSKMKEDSDNKIAELLDLIVKLEQRIQQLEAE